MRVSALALVVTALGCDVDPVSRVPPPDDKGAVVPLPIVPPAVDVAYAAQALVAVRPDRLGPPYPIVLVHGFSGWNDFGPWDYFYDVKDDLLQERGEVVETPALPPYNVPAQRALALAAIVDDVIARTNKAKVHLIGHSQGGLDSRRVVSALGYGDRIASITTVSTPHRGTPVADVAEVAPDGTMNAAGRFLGWLLGALEGDAPDDAVPPGGVEVWQPEMAAVIAALSTTGANEFNVDNQDDPRVAYFSVAGVSNLTPASTVDDCVDRAWEAPSLPDPVDPFLLASGEIVTASFGLTSWRANDGLVPVDSAIWGTFLGCFPADHFDEVGQIADVLPEPSGFSHKELYRRLVDHVRATE